MRSPLRSVLFVSLAYDGALGVGLLVLPNTLAALFGSTPPSPPLLANLVGLFALAIAACYGLPLRDPVRWSPLLWILGPVLKGGGAFLFVADHFLRGSPAPFLIFALADGILAVWTAAALGRFRNIEQ